MAAPAPAAPRGQEALIHLLADLYSWTDLQVLARDLDPEGDLHTWIPGATAPPRDIVTGFLAGAEQRGLLGLPLFRAMTPRRIPMTCPRCHVPAHTPEVRSFSRRGGVYPPRSRRTRHTEPGMVVPPRE